MGFWSSLTGEDAADAAKAAAADQYGKQQSAVQRMLGYGDQFKSSQDALSTKFDPFVSTGPQANDAYSKLLSNPSSVRNLPGYQFDQEEGQRAVDRSSAARGMDASGRTLKDLMRFGTGLADKTYGDQLARLMQGTSLGYQATGAQVGTQARGDYGQLSARSSAYGGDMTSAGTIGQGDVAAATARAAGSQNLLNAGIKLGGMALAPFTGGMSLTSLMKGFGTSAADPSKNNPMWGGGANGTNSDGWF